MKRFPTLLHGIFSTLVLALLNITHMNNPDSRRSFMKTMLAAPVAAAAFSPMLSYDDPAVETSLGHKFKTSLNVYSFNRPLREGTIDLFDVLDFCAEHNFDALDPTGYYFPGYPDVPPDDFMMKFKRKAFLLGLDISGTGVKNDFTQSDPEKRAADVQMVKQWIEAAAKMGIPNIRIFEMVDSE